MDIIVGGITPFNDKDCPGDGACGTECGEFCNPIYCTITCAPDCGTFCSPIS